MSKIEVDAIDKQSGSTLTIGGSGTTVQLGTGASQTGFGRTGTVDWQTSIKTTDFTAANGEGYFVNTTSGGVTVTLPASPSAGAIVAIKDYANTADTNKITINRNGSNIDGGTQNPILKNEGGAVTLVFADSTKGWLVTDAAQKSDLGFPTFISASGGTETIVCTNFKVHTFTGPGTFTVSSVGNACGSNSVDYLVIAGGGGGGHGQACYQASGGGGAGGYRESPGTVSGGYTVSPLGVSPAAAIPVSATAFPITVGGGGAGAPDSPSPNPGGSNGNPSTFSTITSTAGGGGKGYDGASGLPGGSGGGAGTRNDPSPGFSPGTVGAGNTPSVTPPQGNPGGRGTQTPFGGPHSGGGGGGATGAGADGALAGPGGNGGAAATSSINGTPTARAGGGSGGSDTNTAGTVSGGGGVGGGTPLSPNQSEPGTAGTANTGGGAGGGALSGG